MSINIFEWVMLYENLISISLKSVPKGPVDNQLAKLQVINWQ